MLLLRDFAKNQKDRVMNYNKAWLIPMISFCVFVTAMIVVIYLTYNNKSFSFGNFSNPQIQTIENQDGGQVTNLKDFKKALDSSLK